MLLNILGLWLYSYLVLLRILNTNISHNLTFALNPPVGAPGRVVVISLARIISFHSTIHWTFELSIHVCDDTGPSSV